MAQNQGKFALDNLTYDIITVLHEKSKGLEAFDRYMKDVQGEQELQQVFEQMRQSDQNFIQQLQQHLQRRLGQVAGQQQNKAA
jgi:hypothetical protein